jgi:predicted RNase H-like HicB family nuclease
VPILKEAIMILEYISKAIERTTYKKLDDGSWFAEIPGFDGVWAYASTIEICRKELIEVLEEWLLLKVRDRDEIPAVDGIHLRITKDSAA